MVVWKFIKHLTTTMALRSELGISPVLLQAIAHTLTSAASSTPKDISSSNINTGSSIISTAGTGRGDNTSANNNSSIRVLTSSDFLSSVGANNMDGSNTSTVGTASGTVSHLLQNLNEPVASLLNRVNTSTSSMSSPSSFLQQQKTAVLTQAGLSMLGISSDSSTASNTSISLNDNMTFGSNTISSTTNSMTVTESGQPQYQHETNADGNMSSEELANFLLKEEPSDDSLSCEVQLQQSNSQQRALINTQPQAMGNVSSMLSALASQHVQESLLNKKSPFPQKGLFQQTAPIQQQQQQNQSAGIDPVATLSTTQSSGSVSDTTRDTSIMTNSNENLNNSALAPQPQIIIYKYINTDGQEMTLPVPVTSSGTPIILKNDGTLKPVVSAVNTIADCTNFSSSPTTYRVVLQAQPETSLSEVSNSLSMVPGMETFSTDFQADGGHTSMSLRTCSVNAVSDAQNTLDGMSQPCPVCGDKVSGYHYGIFTCESCKGFFKRTVQNNKTFVCPKTSECIIDISNRKKCPACRFQRCLQMGMRLEAIRQDRTRGGRSSYDGCSTHSKPRVSPLEKKIKRVSGRLPGESDTYVDDGSHSHSNLVAILNHNVHKQTSPNASMTPQIPELLRDIMNLEPLLTEDDLPADAITDAPFPEQAVYSYMMQLAELRLYKLVRWARNLPQFGAISTDDQILLLQNCWSELIALSLCWRSIDTPNQISISSSHHITAAWAQHLGFEDVVVQLINITDCFRRLFMDQFEYVALKVLLLITPDVKGLKEPKKIRDFQDKLLEALLTYTSSHYKNMKHKFGELLLRLPELSRISFLSKDILLKSLPTSSASCGLLVELLKGDSKDDGPGDGSGSSGGVESGGTDVGASSSSSLIS